MNEVKMREEKKERRIEGIEVCFRCVDKKGTSIARECASFSTSSEYGRARSFHEEKNNVNESVPVTVTNFAPTLVRIC